MGLVFVGAALLTPVHPDLGFDLPNVPAAAPTHVLTLLGAGLSDAPFAFRGYPPYISFGAIAWGGL